jgi:hypothetical protein
VPLAVFSRTASSGKPVPVCVGLWLGVCEGVCVFVVESDGDRDCVGVCDGVVEGEQILLSAYAETPRYDVAADHDTPELALTQSPLTLAIPAAGIPPGEGLSTLCQRTAADVEMTSANETPCVDVSNTSDDSGTKRT